MSIANLCRREIVAVPATASVRRAAALMPALYSLRVLLAAAGIALACIPAPAQPAAGQPAAATAGAPSPTASRNVYAAGGQVRPAGAVAGDFTAAGGKVIVDQPVAGDASLAGGSVDVRAPVGDDVRAVGGDVSIESTVAGELFASAGNIALTRSAAVGRGAALYGGSVAVQGRIDGDLEAAARTITIDGEVRGNVRLAAEQVTLGPGARIAGSLTYASRSELKKAEGASVAGAVTREQGDAGRGPGAVREWEGPSWAGRIMSFLALLSAAALFLLVAPRFGTAASQRIPGSPWLALGLGFATVVAVPVLAVLLFVTLLGIPVGIALLALYPALLLAGFVVGVLFLARLLAAALRQQPPHGFAGSIAFFAPALLLVLLAATVPFVGVLAFGLLALAGTGACVLELYQRRSGPAAGAASGTAVLGTPATA